MEILDSKPKVDQKYIQYCPSCGVTFTFHESEGVLDQRECPPFMTVKCPACKTSIRHWAHNFVKA